MPETPVNAPREPNLPAATVARESTGSGRTPGAGESAREWAVWLRRGDRLFVGTLTGLALLWLGLHWGRMSAWGWRPVEIEHLPAANYRYEIDINSATWVEWSQFEGVGETLGRRIVAEREAGGPFATIEDLSRVKGLGRKVLEEMRPHLTVRYAAQPATGEFDRRPAEATQSRPAEPGERGRDQGDSHP